MILLSEGMVFDGSGGEPQVHNILLDGRRIAGIGRR